MAVAVAVAVAAAVAAAVRACDGGQTFSREVSVFSLLSDLKLRRSVKLQFMHISRCDYDERG